MGIKVTTIFLVAAFVVIFSGTAAYAANGANGIEVNGDSKIIVTDPNDCPDGTVPVMLELNNFNGFDAVGAIIEVNGTNEIVLYECVPEVPETPLIPETQTAVQEDAYPAEAETTAPRAHLPSTGLMLLPAAAAALAGAGLLVARRRG